jgi:zinc-ribbon domain
MFKNKFISFKPIIFGFITWIVLLVLFFITITILLHQPSTSTVLQEPGLVVLFFLVFMICGALAGYNSSREYLAGFSNGAFIGFFITTIVGLFSNMQYVLLIGSIVFLTILSAIGGLIGVFLYRKTFKEVRSEVCTNCGTQLEENNKFCQECGVETKRN